MLLNGAPKRASWIEMEFDVFVWLCDGRGVKETGKGAVRWKLKGGEGCGVPASDKKGKRLSATPVFPLPTKWT